MFGKFYDDFCHAPFRYVSHRNAAQRNGRDKCVTPSTRGTHEAVAGTAVRATTGERILRKPASAERSIGPGLHPWQVKLLAWMGAALSLYLWMTR